MSAHDETTTEVTSADALAARVARLEAMLSTERAAFNERIAQLSRERDRLREAYDRIRLELELLKRRIYLAKAERIDTAQLELEFAGKLATLDALTAQLDGKPGDEGGPTPPPPPGGKPARTRPAPKGRRDLRDTDLPEERVELVDPEFEELVAKGEAERIGVEESCRLAWQRGGSRRLIVARVKYRVPDADNRPETTRIVTAPLPPETFPRSLAAPSMIAHIASDKYCDGLPLHRQEDRFAREGVPIDRGTMCRWMEDAGATAGATVIKAMRDEAMKTAFCIATDATGVCVQPLPDKGRRQSCRRGHYFVQIADRDHVFFEYTPKETSIAVSDMFKGFSGYVQADAKSVYDLLFRAASEDKPPDDDGAADLAVRHEVGCWCHGRRKFWEAAIAKSAVAREALVRIGRLFALERKWKDRSPVERKALRDQFARPHLEAFFAWAEPEFERVKNERGALRSALGYVVRQKAALMRYLDDGRLELTNNGSERQLRRIAVGRHAWLFVGSDDHAQSAGHLFSLIASARLHRLDPERYLRDLFRVLAQWPRDRFIELAPKYWAATRQRLDPVELEAEIGFLTIPPPLDAANTTQQPPPR
jgi:transposase